ncbi:hypothetical protein [Lysinibacillus sp. RC79]|uniref:hypothetical protein n=1 Tax=Lysinibacillus sp. RC79 TaxID=3156296 RepID=UPI0035114DE7
MTKVKVSIVHDKSGRIVSIAQPLEDAKVIVQSGDGQSVFETEVEKNSILELVSGSQIVDVEKNLLSNKGNLTVILISISELLIPEKGAVAE